MLSHRLIQTIEDHSGTITTAVIDQIRQDPELKHMAALPEVELRDWGYGILRNLGNWLVADRDARLAGRYEGLGRLRFEESVPLHEAVRALHMLKDKAVDYVRKGGFGYHAFEAFAEEELEYLVGRFFDWLVYHLVRGYEEALRDAAHMAA